MNYAFYSKVSLRMPDDWVNKFVKDRHEKIKKDYLNNSIRLFNPIVKKGLDGMDFVNELKTVVISYTGYRIPRFLKNYLKGNSNN